MNALTKIITLIVKEPHSHYTAVNEVPLVAPRRCPLCYSKASLWRHQKSLEEPCSFVVMCSRSEPFGPQDGLKALGCVMFMPPKEFYKDTMREAIDYWNAYHEGLVSIRDKSQELDLIVGGTYNWRDKPEHYLLYLGYNFSIINDDYRHQFSKVEEPELVMCEVLPEDLHLLEITKD